MKKSVRYFGAATALVCALFTLSKISKANEVSHQKETVLHVPFEEVDAARRPNYSKFTQWEIHGIQTQPTLQLVQFSGNDACANDEFGGRCPGESVQQCIIKCNDNEKEMEQTCREIEHWLDRKICWSQVAGWAGTCRAQCRRG